MRCNYFTVWKATCWQCKQPVMVALALDLYNGLHSDVLHGMAWKERERSSISKALGEKYSVKREFRKTVEVQSGYIANVCPACGATQGDYYLRLDAVKALKRGSDFGIIVEVSNSGRILREFKDPKEANLHYNLLEDQRDDQ